MGKIAHYKLDNNTKDYSQNNYDAINHGVSFEDGVVNQSGLFLTSKNDWIDIFNSNQPDLTHEQTITFWCKFSNVTPSNYQIIYEKYAGTSKISMVLLTNGYIEMKVTNDTGSTNFHSFDASLENNKWYFFRFYWDGKGKRIVYVNEIEQFNDTHTGTFTGNIISHHISSSSLGIDANIDDFRIYDIEIDSFEAEKIFYYRGKTEIVINNVDYSDKIYRWNIKDIFGKVTLIEFSLLDSQGSLNIVYSDKFDIYFDGICKYSGLIYENLESTRNGVKKWRVYTTPIYLIDKFISISYSNKTIDYVIKDIVDIYFSSLLTYNNVISLTETYDIDYNGQSVWYIFQDIIKRENLNLYIDSDNDIHLNYLFSIDLGKFYDLKTTNQVRSYNFPDISQTIKNSIIIYSKQKTPDGKGGVAVKYNNLESIAKYKRTIEHVPLTFNELETERQCLIKGKEIIDDIAFTLENGELTLKFDKDLRPGQIIRITYPKKNYDNQQFIIKSVEHQNRPNSSFITIAEVDNNTIELLISVINALRKNEERFRDNTAVISNIIQFSESFNIIMTFSAIRILAGSRKYRQDTQINNFSMRAGEQTEYEVISDEKMTLTNNGKKKLLDILTGVSTVDLTSANLWIGLGIGTTPEAITDINLETEIDINSNASLTKQNMDSTYPVRIDNNTIELQASVLDIDVSSQNFYESGVFDANAGIMYSRLVTSTAFSKNPNETLRLKIQLKVEAI